MFGPKVNIFVSISQSYDYVPREKGSCMRPRYIWMLTVENPKHTFSGITMRDPNPTRSSVFWNEYTKEYELQQVRPTNLGIIGTVLIQRNARTTLGDLTPS